MTATGMGRTWVYARLQTLAADGRVTQISRGRWTVTAEPETPGAPVRLRGHSDARQRGGKADTAQRAPWTRSGVIRYAARTLLAFRRA